MQVHGRHFRKAFTEPLKGRFEALVLLKGKPLNGGLPMPVIETETGVVFLPPEQGGFVLSLVVANQPPVYEVINVGRDWYVSHTD